MSSCTMGGGKRSVKKARSHKKRGGMNCTSGGSRCTSHGGKKTQKKRGGYKHGGKKRGGKKTRTHKKRGGKKTLLQRLGL